MSHKDRARTRDQTRHNQTTVVPFSSLLGILAKRVEIVRTVPAPVPQVTAPVQTPSPRTQPTSAPRTPQPTSGLTGRGTGLVAQDVIRWYQKTRSWRKVAHWMHTPLAEIREWARIHTTDLGILGSEVLQALLQPVRVPRARGQRTLPNTPSDHVPHTRAYVRSAPTVQTTPSTPSAQAAMKPSMHWSGLHLSVETTDTIARHCRGLLISEEEFFHDVFDVSTLSATADGIGIGSGILEELVKAANGMLVSRTVFEALRSQRGQRSLAEFVEQTYDADSIDTTAKTFCMSAQQYMQLVQKFCPHLLQGAAAEA